MVPRKLACSKTGLELGRVGRGYGLLPARPRAELPLPPVGNWPETGAEHGLGAAV